jgi:murein DD-endopeptidase MepM/ murein hydrolase activator NlpD
LWLSYLAMKALLLAIWAAFHPTVISSFGDRCAVRRGDDGECRPRPFRHDGADFGPATVGDPVIASADGQVFAIVTVPRIGTEVVIKHDGGFATGYMHLASAAVRRGQRVRRGETIGHVGLFWASDGVVHVHWRLWARGRPIDPVSRTIGCFDPARDYARAPELTYPLAC